jgi:Ca2+-binding RTX toxin-like protein/subtilisin-like proprotein convertase family protein
VLEHEEKRKLVTVELEPRGDDSDDVFGRGIALNALSFTGLRSVPGSSAPELPWTAWHQSGGFFLNPDAALSHALRKAIAPPKQDTVNSAAVSGQNEFARQSTVVLSDPLLPSQWHNTGTPAVDINMTEAWDYFTGLGIRFGVYDDGIDRAHVDLSANYDPSLHVTVNGVFDDPTIFNAGDAHGTAVAGLIAAVGGNGQGGVGGSFNGRLTGVDIFGTGGNAYLFGAMNEQDRFDVTNHSWGWVGAFADNRLSASWTGFFSGLQDAAQNGRAGLGTIQMVAAGNDRTGFDNANTSNFTSSRFVNAIAAIADNGQVSYYSNPGASLLVASPSNGGTLGITTTDYTGAPGYGAGDYTSTFGGTSAATPIASGVVGLMLEANPDLGYRDVMEILAITARQIGNPAAAGAGASLRPWQFNGASNWNNAGMHFSHDYGFGLIDAFAAVKLADSWNLQQTYANELFVSASDTTAGALPDNNATGISRTVSLTPASASTTPLTIEAIEVQITWSAAHTYSGDLVIELISPTGTVSYLHDRAGGAADLGNWIFTSRAHLGELATGNWTVRITDRAAGDIGTISGITVRAYGSSDVDDNYYYTDEFGAVSTAAAARQILTDTDGGIDTINVAALSTGALINLNTGQASTLAGSSFVIASGTVIENVIGSWSNDTIEGNSAANIIRGNAGNDTILGNGGDDSLYGGAGSDTVDGGDGTDYYYLEAAWAAVQWVVSELTVTFSFVDPLLGTDIVSNVEGFIDSTGWQRTWEELTGLPPVVLPAAPVITGFSDNSGAATDSVTNDATPTLTITTQADVESVEIFINGVSQGPATGGNGSFTFTPATSLADGVYNFAAKATRDGSVSAASTALTVKIDASAPDLVSFTPTDNSAAVNPSSNIVLTFTEDVFAGSGNITLWLVSNDSIWRSIAVGSTEVTIAGAQVTINPGADLPASTAFYVTIEAGALTDLAGNAFTGITGTTAFNFTTSAGNIIEGTAGNDILAGTDSNEVINGFAGADTLSGNGGDDVIDGGAGNDILNGGTNTAVGDTVSYASAAAAVTVTLASTVAQNSVGAGTDTLSGFENLMGSGFNDLLTGSATANRIEGGTGNDILIGGAGIDRLNGGEGSDVYILTVLADKTAAEIADTGIAGVDDLRLAATAAGTLTLLAGDTGLERVVIGTGTGTVAVSTATTALNVDATALANGLTIIGNAGGNRLTGTAFADVIDGAAGNDTLSGGLGDDYLNGGAGTDTVTYAGQTDSVTVSLAVTTVQATGVAGNDQILNVENLIGGNGNDTLTGNAGANNLNGGSGDDFITGGAGNDTLAGGTNSAAGDTVNYADAIAAVTVSLALTASQNTGGAGRDTLSGFENLVGSGFGDVLTGSTGNNVIRGGAGADRITGGDGTDYLYGGADADTFVFTAASNSRVGNARDVIFDLQPGDVLDFSAIDANGTAAGNTAFTNVGQTAFTGIGQLRIYQETGGTWLVEGNTGGTLDADFQIELSQWDAQSAINLVL